MEKNMYKANFRSPVKPMWNSSVTNFFLPINLPIEFFYSFLITPPLLLQFDACYDDDRHAIRSHKSFVPICVRQLWIESLSQLSGNFCVCKSIDVVQRFFVLVWYSQSRKSYIINNMRGKCWQTNTILHAEKELWLRNFIDFACISFYSLIFWSFFVFQYVFIPDINEKAACVSTHSVEFRCFCAFIYW